MVQHVGADRAEQGRRHPAEPTRPDDDQLGVAGFVHEGGPGVAADDALRSSIMAHVEGRLAKFKWPRTIDFVDELPREPTGKLLKRQLRDPYWEGRDRAI